MVMDEGWCVSDVSMPVFVVARGCGVMCHVFVTLFATFLTPLASFDCVIACFHLLA